MTTPQLLLAYYGDDFTGSTDVLEALTINGVSTVLFLHPPSADELRERFSHVRAVGVAGVSRSMTPQQMTEALPPIFTSLKRLNASVYHYKLCSTFDSAPHIGSIGHAAELGWQVFQPTAVPLIVAAPSLRRYVVFGNLFATVGDITYRLDRHPTMSRHPVTPMNESDLRLHLGQQTQRAIAVLDLFHLTRDDLHRTLQSGAEIVLFDTVDEGHLYQAGRLIWEELPQPIFALGSSGLEYALTHVWQKSGLITRPAALQRAQPVSQMLIMSGSASPVTNQQIAHAIAHGAAEMRLDTTRLIDPEQAQQAQDEAVALAVSHLNAGKTLVMYTARGPEDPALEATRQRMLALSVDPTQTAAIIGAQQGKIIRRILEAYPLSRVCVAGGDTSGHTALSMGIYALEFVTSIAPGAPLCRASAHHAAVDGLEIAFKGGQNGQEDYFMRLAQGGA